MGNVPSDLAEYYPNAYRRLVGTLLVLGVPWDEASEIAHEAFVRLIPRWARVRAYDNPDAWLRTVALRLWNKRRARLRREVPMDGATRDATPPHTERDLAVREAVRELPAGQREVVTLFYLCDLTIEGLSRELSVPVGTVKSRLSRGRSALASSRHLEGIHREQ